MDKKTAGKYVVDMSHKSQIYTVIANQDTHFAVMKKKDYQEIIA